MVVLFLFLSKCVSRRSIAEAESQSRTSLPGTVGSPSVRAEDNIRSGGSIWPDIVSGGGFAAFAPHQPVHQRVALKSRTICSSGEIAVTGPRLHELRACFAMMVLLPLDSGARARPQVKIYFD
jgi:hypothetical protein